MKLAIAQLSVPRAGETVSGDAVVVRRDGPRTLVAVIDALGHGPGAAEVAAHGTRFLEAAQLEARVEPLIAGLHQALAGGRGAAAMICVFDEDAQRLRGCGVGNVSLRSINAEVPVVLSEGILGVRVRKFHYFEAPMRPRQRLLFFSDGIATRAGHIEVNDPSPGEACARLLRELRHSHDDATVLVVDIEV